RCRRRAAAWLGGAAPAACAAGLRPPGCTPSSIGASIRPKLTVVSLPARFGTSGPPGTLISPPRGSRTSCSTSESPHRRAPALVRGIVLENYYTRRSHGARDPQ